MICLGIETSCDETALALVRGRHQLGERMASQVDLHALFGGVVPELASREHLRRAAALYQDLLRDSGVRPEDIAGVAVARGPGLLGSLLVGVNLAKGLALGLGVPLVGVNHLHAHLMAAGLERDLPMPCLGLLISGGHTHLYRISSPLDFQLLGRTLDDAAGEALDKAAKLVNLPYPGGKFIDMLGRGHQPEPDLFPRPFTSRPGLDFSFSGLKTAVARHVADNPGLRIGRLPEDALPDVPGMGRFCASVNWAVAQTLRIKTRRALEAHREAAIRPCPRLRPLPLPRRRPRPRSPRRGERPSREPFPAWGIRADRGRRKRSSTKTRRHGEFFSPCLRANCLVRRGRRRFYRVIDLPVVAS